MKTWLRFSLLGVAVLVLLACALVALNLRDEPDVGAAVDAVPATAAQVQRGAYLARAGNCAGCHTLPGGAPYAGGLGIATPFGTVYAGNLTPDAATGIGGWNAAHFWRALHNGRSKDGHLLYPAFPYPHFTRTTREDADALFAYLRTVPAVAQPSPAHALRFPYSTQAALAVWRALFFTPANYQPQPDQSAAWNRGDYLVNGLGHCAACHSPRNALGASSLASEFNGGVLPAQKWYAPSLRAPQEAGVAGWAQSDVVALLRNGVVGNATVTGPMAAVVYGSTQYLSDDDLAAMASYLQALPQTPPPAVAPAPAGTAVLRRGDKLYAQHCAACHGEQGQGAVGAYPALAGNRAVTLGNTTNLVRMLVGGGFAPATHGNPRPYGMPPLGQRLNNREMADVLSFIRQSWGNQAPEVPELDVLQAR